MLKTAAFHGIQCTKALGTSTVSNEHNLKTLQALVRTQQWNKFRRGSRIHVRPRVSWRKKARRDRAEPRGTSSTKEKNSVFGERYRRRCVKNTRLLRDKHCTGCPWHGCTLNASNSAGQAGTNLPSAKALPLTHSGRGGGSEHPRRSSRNTLAGHPRTGAGKLVRGARPAHKTTRGITRTEKTKEEIRASNAP